MVRRFTKFGLQILILTIICISGTAMASDVDMLVPYDSYNYNFWSNSIPSPPAYVPVSTIDSRDLEVGSWRKPQDLFVAEDSLYLLDSGNNRIIRINEEWNVTNVITDFVREDGSIDRFNNPEGIFVTDGGTIYVADTGNGRIIELSSTGTFHREIGPPVAKTEGIIPEGFRYRPSKVVVDNAGRIYVLVSDVYEGLLEFTGSGEFRGFIGAPRVIPNIFDYLWRRIATKEQRKRMVLFLPTEYSGIDIDDQGFIYATVAEGSVQNGQAIRRLNPSGSDVLRRRGFHIPQGDLKYPYPWDEASIAGPSIFVDITTHEYGVYSALDSRRGRVFTYDGNGNLLWVFGAKGAQKGTLQNATAIDIQGDRILILDADKARITIYKPTEYAQAILAAIEYHYTGRYDESTEMWNRALQLNANCDLAYTGIGRALLRQDRFREAMDNFRLGSNRRDYSEALSLHRREVIEANFGYIVAVLLVLAVGFFVWRRVRQIQRERYPQIAVTQHPFFDTANTSWRARVWRTLQSLRYALYVVFHPFDGFWDLKHERRGTMPAAAILLALVTATYVFVRQYTGFIFNPRDLTRLNILIEAASILVPFILWSMVNWALTTLMEGKGTFRQIFIASAFALTPLILVYIPATVISNYIILEEGALYYFLMSLGTVWALGLLFFGTMVTHDYDGLKTVATSGLTLVGMGVILFLSVLFFSLADQFFSFVGAIYTEIVFRLS